MPENYWENEVYSDNDDEEYGKAEDKYNKMHTISEIEKEVIKKQKEIEKLLQNKELQQNSLKESAYKESVEIKRKQHEQKLNEKRFQEEQRKLKENKRHILQHQKGLETRSSFASKLQNTRKEEKLQEIKKQQFINARKYTFGDTLDETILVTPQDTEEIEKFSGIQIDQRYIEAGTLETMFEDKKILRLDRLFQKVYPPDFKEPDYPNWVVIGVITEKSDVKFTNNKSSKYLSLSISNFILNLKLLLFGDAFTKYWKLKVGDIIGILNPRILPYKNMTTKTVQTFNLTLNSNFNSIVEIGKAKNLGYCRASFRDKKCNVPIDKSQTDYCEYHQNTNYIKSASQRMDLNGLSTSGGLNKLKDLSKVKTVLMNKNYKSSDIKSYGVQVFENPYANKFDNSHKNDGFSSSHAKKAFMDENYVNPQYLNNLDNKRKILKNKKKEAELRLKLANMKGGETLIKNDSSQNIDEEQAKKNAKIFKTAYSANVVNSLGFDPTRNSLGRENDRIDIMLDTRGRAKVKVETLNSIRKRKELHLSPSRDSRNKRSRKWKENIKHLKEYNDEAQFKEDYENHLSDEYSSANSTPTKPDKAQVDVDQQAFDKRNLNFDIDKTGEDASSDSDLDIDFGENKDKYLKIIRR